MCEFKVYLGEEEVMGDVVYAEEREGSVLLRTILGEEKVLKGCRILQVDVRREVLRLARG
ncbi:MAG: CooT family nickel-binding protein [Candidatus Nezhaarchaeota archaeon]|nr:CooT family nickel-binding protein [Candidatus Nezhaarchaeota archaeon]